MPKVRVGDIDMYYEVHGEGEPLVIINGAGASVAVSYRRIPAFSREFRLVLFDNRGVGLSDKPDMTYTTELMADDLAGLLDALDIESAHIQGVSMGGMIAQQFALRHPNRVRSLVLAVTYCGGPHSVIPPFADPHMDFHKSTPEEAAEALLRVCVTREYIDKNPDAFQKLVAFTVAHPMVHDGLTKHTQAVATHDTYDRLPEIRVPTLVLAGDSDRIMPVENARILAGRIPNSMLVIFPNAGHMLVEVANEVDLMVLDFFKSHRTEGHPPNQPPIES
jgi:pimeloyl-ACP methyl ester carboxylesterase